MEYRTVSTRLSVDKFTIVNDYCSHKNISPSALIKELILDEITPSAPSHIAGRNVIEYDKKQDSFVWLVELDNGKRVAALKSCSPEYIRNLSAVILDALNTRNELLGRKSKNSVPVPKKIIRGRK